MATAAPPASSLKQVMYLWGAGATHAEAQYRAADPINLLMTDNAQGDGVATRILNKLPAKWRASFATADHGTDIEKLISLLIAGGVNEYARVAERIRQLYFDDIRVNLSRAQVIDNPALAIALLRLHADIKFQHHEVLTGIVTTNHDGLLQVAAQAVHGAVNLGIPFSSQQIGLGKEGQHPPLVHLHGSFTWTFGLPLKVSPLSGTSPYSRDLVWIPPSTVKDSRTYPFNKLAGLAYELLSRQCDVLRVVGSSLTQNDWHVLSMLFNAQRHRELTKGNPFRIELIMPQDHGDKLKATLSYLRNLTPIGYLTEGDFDAYKDADAQPGPSDLSNPFFYWLRQKIEFHRVRDHLTLPLDAAVAVIGGRAQ
jgi:hypothetical protein